jgi:hypothetical protein
LPCHFGIDGRNLSFQLTLQDIAADANPFGDFLLLRGDRHRSASDKNGD